MNLSEGCVMLSYAAEVSNSESETALLTSLSDFVVRLLVKRIGSLSGALVLSVFLMRRLKLPRSLNIPTSRAPNKSDNNKIRNKLI